MKNNRRHRGGRPNKFKPEYIEQARKLCQFGLTDPELAEFFEVHLQTINNWKAKYPEFFSSLRLECAMRARMWAALKGRTDGALFSRLGYR